MARPRRLRPGIEPLQEPTARSDGNPQTYSIVLTIIALRDRHCRFDPAAELYVRSTRPPGMKPRLAAFPPDARVQGDLA